MSLKSELAEMKDALAALKERIEADDAEAIEEGVQLKADIEAKEMEIAQAEAKAAVLEVIGTKPEEEEKMEGIKSMDTAALKDQRGSVSTYVKAYNDIESAPTVPTFDGRPIDVIDRLGVRDLFSQAAISGNSHTYVVMGATEGEPDVTSEGSAKPRIHVAYTPTTEALAKIACYMKESDELLQDAPYLESVVRNRGRFAHKQAVEAYLVEELLDASGVQQGAASISFDNILAAKQDIIADTGYIPDAMIINPADLTTLLQSKDDNLQYLLGGPAYGSYGNGSYNENPKIWGLTVVQSNAVPAGECVVGAFKACAEVVTKAGEGLRVEVSNSDQDDFIKNLVTVRIEERILLATLLPAAFAIVGTEESGS